VEGRLRRLGGRPRRLGRDPARLPRRRVHRPPRGRPGPRLHGRGRARACCSRRGSGRWGNWWNQELYGKPTDLPWGLKIDVEHRVAGYENNATFHPTFLYEFVYDLVGVGLLLLLDRRFRFKPPALFALYVSYYTAGRFLEELIRIDPAHHFAGLRLNAWVSIVVFVCSTVFFVWWQFLRGGEGPGPGGAAARAAGVRRACDGDPARPRPVAPLPCRPWSCASSSWTSTPSRAPSTCC
jgi:hypothetical protein